MQVSSALWFRGRHAAPAYGSPDEQRARRSSRSAKTKRGRQPVEIDLGDPEMGQAGRGEARQIGLRAAGEGDDAPQGVAGDAPPGGRSAGWPGSPARTPPGWCGR